MKNSEMNDAQRSLSRDATRARNERRLRDIEAKDTARAIERWQTRQQTTRIADGAERWGNRE